MLRFADDVAIIAENEKDFRNNGSGDGKGFTYENERKENESPSL